MHHGPPWSTACASHVTPPPPHPQVTAAIVTCGGLCPGLNDVVQVRSLTMGRLAVAVAVAGGVARPWLRARTCGDQG